MKDPLRSLEPVRVEQCKKHVAFAGNRRSSRRLWLSQVPSADLSGHRHRQGIAELDQPRILVRREPGPHERLDVRCEGRTRRGIRATPFLPDWAKQANCCLYQLRWSPELLRENPVTIVIPTKNQGDLLKKCISSLGRTVDAANLKLIMWMTSLMRKLPGATLSS